jgi:ribonuclease J
VVLTCFASHIDRVDHALRAADASGRSVTLLGRSMRRNVDIAEQLGELRRAARPTVPPPKLIGERPRSSLVVCTGSQAEEFAVLARAARGEHPHLVIGGRDTIVFATRPVPGNEEAVASLQRDLAVRGATIVTHEDAPIHVSGHGSADEVAELIELVRPRFLIPVHGEPEMLEAQARIGVARAGLDRGAVLVAGNGDVIELAGDRAEIVDHVVSAVVQADAAGLPLEPR